MSPVDPQSSETLRLLDQVRAGVPEAVDRLFALHLLELRTFVGLRLDPKLRRRLDPSDVVQEAQLEAMRRLQDYLAQPALPFHLWLRQIAQDQVIMAHRRHVQAEKRSLVREEALPDSAAPTPVPLFDPEPTPSRQLVRQEAADQVRQAIDQLPEADRTILLLRHYQSLSNQEAAAILGIDPAAASKRYGRALRRLGKLLGQGPEEASP